MFERVRRCDEVEDDVQVDRVHEALLQSDERDELTVGYQDGKHEVLQ